MVGACLKRWALIFCGDGEVKGTSAYLLMSGGWGRLPVMGDNRDRYMDSRVMLRVSYIQDKYLVGKIVLLIKDGETGGVVFMAIEPY
ncbi:MAG: hypothetical protein COB36_02490 [Alphaproteobacteria bacterium]|nr:MAG: hypothetical protein COB36_02490 [Alphaproteobacteria bacterium]